MQRGRVSRNTSEVNVVEPGGSNLGTEGQLNGKKDRRVGKGTELERVQYRGALRVTGSV